MKIIVDAMGGDLAPKDIVLGAASAAAEFDVTVALVGQEPVIRDILRGADLEGSGNIEIVHAESVIPMDGHAEEVRQKRDSSLTVALDLLKNGGGDAFVSAGSTVAVLSGATLYAKRIKGVRRAALCPVIPTMAGGTLLIDCGANIDCTAEALMQFAYIGQAYARCALGVDNPRVGLLNIGSEESKGGDVRVETYQMLAKAKDEGKVNFIGNVEGRDVLQHVCDVLVTDGFSGNILLKSIEGAGMFVNDFLKATFLKNAKTKMSAMLVKKSISEFRKMMDYTEVGGAPFLGLAKPVIKAHGSSNQKAIRGAIKQAIRYASSNTIDEISRTLQSDIVENN